MRRHIKPHKIYTVTVSEKGQIAVPTDIQRYIGLRPGTQINIEVRDEDIVFTVPHIL